MDKIAPFILGLQSTQMSDEEADFLAETKPFGVILFARNVQSLDQVKKLVEDAKKACGNPDLFVLIDQEGGKVARLRPPLVAEYPPAADFGMQYQSNAESAKKACFDNYAAIGKMLFDLGINVDCAPVCDVPVKGAHDVIGNRAFGYAAETVAELAKAAMGGLLSQGVYPVIKHIPGHGRAFADSHTELPMVGTGLEELRKSDFLPFRILRDAPFAMTAHVKYTAIDAAQCATASAKVIQETIREDIGFKGLLMSDDIGMKALQGDPADIARDCLAAGCDLVLYCNGSLAEMKQAVERSPKDLRESSRKRLDYALQFMRQAKKVA